MSYSKALGTAIAEEMRRDENVLCIGLDLAYYGGAFGVTRGLAEEFGTDRIMNMPISEAGYTGLAVGAAATGLRPVVELQFGDWVTIASDQLVNQAANMRYMFGGTLSIPMVMRLPCGGGGSAGAQHSHMFESWFSFVAGLKVAAPSTPADAKGLLKTAIRDNNPVIFFEHRQCYQLQGEVPDDPEYLIPFGKADIKREGKDITIVTYSYMVHMALEAAKILEKDGISAEIIDLRTIKPLDTDTIINSVKKTNRVLCLQETWLTCSVASEVAAIISEQAFDYLDAPVKRFGSPDCPVPFAPVLENYVLPNTDKIVRAVKEMF
ncbi:MAG TPA: alpha-ketoacid dehydrogenase subunit beta [Clostridiaceae bacterium]|nr:alpha-ketoacid dehydrogenase subunit beta [Clostridiaceae bacterium]